MLIGFLNLLTPIPLLGSLKYPRHSRSYLPLRPPRQTLIICSSLRPPRLTHSFITSQIPQISSIYSPLIILGNCLMGLFHLFLIVQKFSIFFSAKIAISPLDISGAIITAAFVLTLCGWASIRFSRMLTIYITYQILRLGKTGSIFKVLTRFAFVIMVEILVWIN